MGILRYTLVADGPSDACLLHIIEWLLRELNKPSPRPFGGFKGQVADFRWDREPPRALEARITAGFRRYPCDVLFIHRDAERQSIEDRHTEIHGAVTLPQPIPHVPVVPVRMTEAWLMIDERAIRRAADNPNGKVKLNLPALQNLESAPDPKSLLRESLLTASELTGRRLDQFKPSLSERIYRVAALIRDYSALRRLVAFQRLESEAQSLLFSA